jgi:uroporphyrinogen III methyltransferase/synthase
MATGIVYLIGAGPGNPKLITVRGLECLRKAEVVVYDRLGTEQLLTEARPDAELIYVGKASGNHSLPQGEINQVLVRKAQEGKTVARLKGGDPFVFGRGGEEAEVLVQNGIPFEIVPGITSAISAPAYAGIPVTHRTAASSFTVVTGHEDPTKQHSAIDWEKLACTTGTVVFLMGLANLGGIARRLTEHGRSPETPVALVSWGSRTNQQTVTGTLATIEAELTAHPLPSPAVIVVGEVVALREKLCWFENRPLFGRRVAIVRAWDQAADLAGWIERLGGEPVDMPVVSDPEVLDVAEAERTLRSLADSRYLVFRGSGVERFFGGLRDLGRDSRALAGPRLVSLDMRATDALWSHGIRADFAAGRVGLAEELLGVQGIDAVVLAGSEAAATWVELLGDQARSVETVACLDEEVALDAITRGLTVRVVPAEPTAEALAEELGRCLAARQAEAGKPEEGRVPCAI